MWIYTRGGTKLHSQLSGSTTWELIGPLESEMQGSVYHRKP